MSGQNLLFDAPPPDMAEILGAVARARLAFIKFLSANDLGLTGSHQAGLYLTKDCWPFFLERAGVAGENNNREITLEWGAGRRTASVFHWYGQGTRSEYRLTRLKDFFRDQEERFVGALFLLYEPEDDVRGVLQARVLDQDEDIETFLNFLGLTPAETGGILRFDLEERLRPYCEAYAREVGGSFPEARDVSRRAQRIFDELYSGGRTATTEARIDVFSDADRALLALIEIEYALFRYLERQIYQPLLESRFTDLERLLAVSLEINNRRKSRAGLALENHLAFLFQRARLACSSQETTEEGKKPDFVFPGIEQYRDRDFPVERLFFLGAKTTCKDRWRQILNEAHRIPIKHLCTLQQGFTSAQLREMREAGVRLVVPGPYHDYCKKEDRAELLTLAEFLTLVRTANGMMTGLFDSGENSRE